MPQQSRFSVFITELKRRRVFRVAAVYGGVAFVLFQVIDSIFEPLHIPQWIGSLIIVLLLVGFPLAVGLAWVFDITPEGIVRTDRIPSGSGGRDKVPPGSGKPLTGNRTLAVIAILAVAFGVWSWLREPGDAVRDKSVAVIPFVNFSDSKDDEYFSDGITDDILTHLSKIGELKVIARTSVMQYKNTDKRVRDIARELGVASILEGSVRRSGNTVRITSQLIDAETEEHLWAETYDRELTDIFAIQTDVARQIARALKAKLLPDERERLEKRPTENLEAYEWYLRGNDYLRRGSFAVAGDRANLDKAVSAYQRAIELDTKFAAAYARLSYTYTALQFFHSIHPHGERALQAVERALELDPDLPEGHLALGYYYNLVKSDFDQALESFATAQKGLQSNSDLLSEIGLVQMRQGKWDQALSNLQLAADLDPRSPPIHYHLANIYLYLRQYSEAERVLNHLKVLIPDNPLVHAYMVELALLRNGDVKEAREIVEEASTYLQPTNIMWAGSQLINRLGYWRFGILRQDFKAIMRDFSVTHRKAGNQIYYFSMAQLHGLAQQPELSQAYYDSALTWIEARLAAAPGSFKLQSDLGLACAFLGLKDRAIAAGMRSKELMPISTCHW